MKKIHLLAFWLVVSMCAAAIASTLIGCTTSTVKKGQDPLVIRIEQSEVIAYATIDTFLKIDDVNRPFFRTNAPAMHNFAEWLREPTLTGDRRWVSYIRGLDNVKLAYKSNKALSNDVVVALSTVESIVSQSQRFISDTRK